MQQHGKVNSSNGLQDCLNNSLNGDLTVKQSLQYHVVRNTALSSGGGGATPSMPNVHVHLTIIWGINGQIGNFL